jgi:hypothetical protein
LFWNLGFSLSFLAYGTETLKGEFQHGQQMHCSGIQALAFHSWRTAMKQKRDEFLIH